MFFLSDDILILPRLFQHTGNQLEDEIKRMWRNEISSSEASLPNDGHLTQAVDIQTYYNAGPARKSRHVLVFDRPSWWADLFLLSMFQDCNNYLDMKISCYYWNPRQLKIGFSESIQSHMTNL